MTDEQLNSLLERAAQGDKDAATAAVLEIASRLLEGDRLTADAVVAVAGGLMRAAKSGEALNTFWFERVAPARGRPKGAVKSVSLARAMELYGAARGLIPAEQASVGARELQRIKAEVRGAPGKPGRPKKSDKK